MSATFSQPGVIGRYLETITERSFTVYESQERVTELVYVPKKPANFLSRCLVFLLQRGTMDLAYTIARTRRRLPENSAAAMSLQRSLTS